MWYLIENVVGVLRALGKMIPFVVQVYTTLHKHLPFFAHGHDVLRLRDIDDFPGSRHRVFFKGMRRDVLMNRPLPKPLSGWGVRISLQALLEKGLPNVKPEDLKTKILRQNLMDYIKQIKVDMKNGKAGCIAVVELDRGFGLTFKPQWTYDYVNPLKCGGPQFSSSLLLIWMHRSTRGSCSAT